MELEAHGFPVIHVGGEPQARPQDVEKLVMARAEAAEARIQQRREAQLPPIRPLPVVDKALGARLKAQEKALETIQRQLAELQAQQEAKS